MKKTLMWLVFTGGLLVIAIGVNQSVLPRLNHDSALSELVSESRQKKCLAESQSFRELDAEELPLAISFIETHKDYAAYHLLMTLRIGHRHYYEGISDETKAAVLCSDLEHATFMNDWGSLLTNGSGIASTALLETGHASLPHLFPLLDDERKAPVFGSIEHAASVGYKYRRKDYAFRCVVQALGEQYTFDDDLQTRDRRIESLRARLRARLP
jgi:hypothetical protein